MLMANKLKSCQLKYLLIRTILTLFEESYKTILLFTFLIFKDSFSEQELEAKVKSLLLKKLKKL